MMKMRVGFSKVTFRISILASCVRCKKTYTRTKTFVQTLSPFSRNEDGTVKTAKQVLTSVREEAQKWIIPPHCGEQS